MNRSGADRDAWMALEAQALARERRNRPRWMIVLAGCVVVAAAAIAGLGARRYASATRDLELARHEAEQILTLVAELNARRAAAETRPGRARRAPIQVAELSALAEQAGVPARLAPPRESRTSSGDGIILTLIYTDVRAPSLQPLLSWITLACEQFEGLRVESLRLQAEQPGPGWVLDVTFKRWEQRS